MAWPRDKIINPDGKDIYGIIPPSGSMEETREREWPKSWVLPQGLSGLLSSAGWTADYPLTDNTGNEGFIQQTFLGASIQTFDLSAGFGDTTSQLSLTLVNDEYNRSDRSSLGWGDDPYHNGKFDQFRPPPVGTPVYFKFGKNPADVEQAFRQTMDDLSGFQTLPDKVTIDNPWGWVFDRNYQVKNPDGFGPEDFEQHEPYALWQNDKGFWEDRTLLWKSDSYWRGRCHFNFGGILQSYTETKGPGGHPTYNVTVTDPREILSNVQVLLNNYQGTIFNNKNLINVYGFLEYDPTPETLQYLENIKLKAGVVRKLNKSNVEGGSNTDSFYDGVEAKWKDETGWEFINKGTPESPKYPLATGQLSSRSFDAPGGRQVQIPASNYALYDQYLLPRPQGGEDPPEFWPITGQGFSRRTDKGMPWYRVSQGLAALLKIYGEYPFRGGKAPANQIDNNEFLNSGFCGRINFRGFNYVVDFSGIPVEKIPLLYYMEFDQIDLLSLAQELCDIISHDLFVSLLPVIKQHPYCEFLYNYNINEMKNGRDYNIIAGIIRLDAIDKTTQPKYGAIKSYLDNLAARGIDVENRDVGFELSNVTTDKFLAGGQEVDMYYFSSERDRDELYVLEEDEGEQNLEILNEMQWDIRTQLQQQIIPYYGLLNNTAVTIPRGFGPYQQILLDSSALNANGVGNQYIATEMELRAALVDYATWKRFLLSYNDVYIEDINEHQAFLSVLSQSNDQIDDVLNRFKTDIDLEGLNSEDQKDKINEILDYLVERQYAVTVPRCVWRSDHEDMRRDRNDEPTGILESPCSPPFGYPLYYKRATRIGINEAGFAKVINAKQRVITDLEEIRKQQETDKSPLIDTPNRDKDIARKRVEVLEKQLRDWVASHKNNPNYKQLPKYKSLAALIEREKETYNNWDELEANALDNQARIAELEDLLTDPDNPASLRKFLFNVEKKAEQAEENAKKVYEFVRAIADECLGKKFLVRMPKSVNLNYRNNIATFEDALSENNIQYGPFGFKPRPINATGDTYLASEEWELLQEEYKTEKRVKWDDFIEPFHPYLRDYELPLYPEESGEAKIKISERYADGALKGNYNPFAENWEFNYKPEPQGGFFTYDQFKANVSALDFTDIRSAMPSLPLTIRQGLCPVDVTNFLSDSNRIQCYAKYENSHLLDFAGVDGKEMSQQVIDILGNGGFMPDVVERLPNNRETKPDLSFSSMDEFKKKQELGEKIPNSMAFVKCDLAEKFYMPPKLEEKTIDIWARNYDLKLTIPKPKFREKAEGCSTVTVVDYDIPTPVFSVPKDGGREETYGDDTTKETPPSGYLGAKWVCFARRETQYVGKTDERDRKVEPTIIISDKDKLDDEHVYALITVPGRIKSNKDLRWKDGPLKTYQAVEKAHLMTQDVVNVFPEFNKPSFPEKNSVELACGPAPIFETKQEAITAASGYGLTGAYFKPDISDYNKKILDPDYSLPSTGWRPGKEDNWITLSLGQISQAEEATKVINQGFAADQPQVSLGYISPSPIVPDMVAIPLMSMERTYGPWLSASQLEAGGRVKFSDIGGRVEFIKNEELTPWNYAGYSLLNSAGALQANFSNSLLLFSERGGFVMPDAPTGVALAKVLQAEGPIVTSIGINVSQGGVKTTVKLDLYTSNFGKLAKQKEEAISKLARERQKLTDEKNAATRRGLGKRSTSEDLYNSVMQGGGDRLLRQIEKNQALKEANADLAEELDEQILIVGPNGGTEMSTKQYQKMKSAFSENAGDFDRQGNKSVVSTATQFLVGYSNMPTDDLPTTDIINNSVQDMRTNDRFNREQ